MCVCATQHCAVRDRIFLFLIFRERASDGRATGAHKKIVACAWTRVPSQYVLFCVRSLFSFCSLPLPSFAAWLRAQIVFFACVRVLCVFSVYSAHAHSCTLVENGFHLQRARALLATSLHNGMRRLRASAGKVQRVRFLCCVFSYLLKCRADSAVNSFGSLRSLRWLSGCALTSTE